MLPEHTSRTTTDNSKDLENLSQDTKLIVAAITRQWEDRKNEFREARAEKKQQIAKLEAEVMALRRSIRWLRSKLMRLTLMRDVIP